MRLLFGNLWRDERGSLLVTDWVFIASVLVLVFLPMIASVRHRAHQASPQVHTSNAIRLGHYDGTETAN